MIYVVDFTDGLFVRKIVDIEAASEEEALSILHEDTSVFHVRSCQLHAPPVLEENEEEELVISLEKTIQMVIQREKKELSDSEFPWFSRNTEQKIDHLFERFLQRYLSAEKNNSFHNYYGYSLLIIYEKFPTLRSFSRYINAFLESSTWID